MAFFYNQVPSVSAVFSLYTSFSAITMLFRTILCEIMPKRTRDYITAKVEDYFFSSYLKESSFTFVIEKEWEFGENQMFRAAEVYLPTRLNVLSTETVVVGLTDFKNPKEQLKLGIVLNTKIKDEFEGIHLEWTLHSIETKNYPYEKRYFHLTCKKEFREKIMTDYFTYVTKSAQKIMESRENLNIYTYNKEMSNWQSSIFEHHATFETLAIEPDLKKTLIDDLDTFSKGNDFFESVGHVRKRGYLLYGPPGTGKSSMVAAIANYLKYHIYDLQLQSISDDGELRRIITSTRNRSILLIEDIDCGSDALHKRQSNEKEEAVMTKKGKKMFDGVSLAGLLNFVDGLWSSCGEERMIIFTANHKEKLDPALLRPGTMDLHILMDNSTPFVFKKLVSLYLQNDDHVLFDAIEKLVLEVGVTPAELTQQLMVSTDADVALNGLLKFLETKKMNAEEDTKVEEDGEIEDAESNKSNQMQKDK